MNRLFLKTRRCLCSSSSFFFLRSAAVDESDVFDEERKYAESFFFFFFFFLIHGTHVFGVFRSLLPPTYRSILILRVILQLAGKWRKKKGRERGREEEKTAFPTNEQHGDVQLSLARVICRFSLRVLFRRSIPWSGRSRAIAWARDLLHSTSIEWNE